MGKNNNEQLSRINRQIARDLKRARLLAGLTQKDLANALGVSYQQIQKYESGASQISAARLVQLTGLMQITCPELEPAAPHAETQDIDEKALKICSRIMGIKDPACREKIVNAVYCLTS